MPRRSTRRGGAGTRNMTALKKLKESCSKDYECQSGRCMLEPSKDPILAMITGRRKCSRGEIDWACIRNNDCPTNSTCTDGICKKVVKRGSSRRRRQYASHLATGEGCVQDTDCDHGVCKKDFLETSKKCRLAPDGYTCKSDLDCKNGVCHGLTYKCDSSKKPLHTFCNESDCQSGLQCYNHKCRIPASSQQKCDFDYDCMDSKCIENYCK